MKKSVFKPQKRSFRITGYAYLWVLLFLIGIIFTQALRNQVSYVFMIIVLALPFTELAYVLIGRASVSAAFSCGSLTARKNEPVTISVIVRNNAILPMPFVEARLILPENNSLRSAEIAAAVPLPARGSYRYAKAVSFPYKGEYECGIRDLYVSSLFRFFRMRIKIDKKSSVLVLPGRLDIEPIRDRYVGETSAVSNDPVSGTDSAEITEIKEYRPGDPMRNIHWKLSGKAQELMTKHFGSENGMNAAVIADAGRCFAPGAGTAEDVNEYCADAVCELSLFAALTELRRGRRASLIYCDGREGEDAVIKKPFFRPEELEDFVPFYAAAEQKLPVDPRTLLKYPEEGVENDVIFVTAKLDADKSAALCETAAENRAVTLVCFMPLSKVSGAAELNRETDRYLEELNAAKVNIRIIYEKEIGR